MATNLFPLDALDCAAGRGADVDPARFD
jgi:hypothetical protein